MPPAAPPPSPAATTATTDSPTRGASRGMWPRNLRVGQLCSSRLGQGLGQQPTICGTCACTRAPPPPPLPTHAHTRCPRPSPPSPQLHLLPAGRHSRQVLLREGPQGFPLHHHLEELLRHRPPDPHVQDPGHLAVSGGRSQRWRWEGCVSPGSRRGCQHGAAAATVPRHERRSGAACRSCSQAWSLAALLPSQRPPVPAGPCSTPRPPGASAPPSRLLPACIPTHIHIHTHTTHHI
jgi:hypothetical protein